MCVLTGRMCSFVCVCVCVLCDLNDTTVKSYTKMYVADVPGTMVSVKVQRGVQTIEVCVCVCVCVYNTLSLSLSLSLCLSHTHTHTHTHIHTHM